MYVRVYILYYLLFDLQFLLVALCHLDEFAITYMQMKQILVHTVISVKLVDRIGKFYYFLVWSGRI